MFQYLICLKCWCGFSGVASLIIKNRRQKQSNTKEIKMQKREIWIISPSIIEIATQLTVYAGSNSCTFLHLGFKSAQSNLKFSIWIKVKPMRSAISWSKTAFSVFTIAFCSDNLTFARINTALSTSHCPYKGFLRCDQIIRAKALSLALSQCFFYSYHLVLKQWKGTTLCMARFQEMTEL